MDHKSPLIKKAVLTLAVGMAFLFFSCQGSQMMKPGRPSIEYSGAVADYEAGRYESALKSFNGILKAQPDHPEIRMIRYYRAFCYYYVGDYKKSINLATNWMKDYPDNPDQYKVQKLAGDASRASGNMYEACFWLTISLKTAGVTGIPPHIQDLISSSIADVIGRSNEEELEKIKQLDSIAPFLSSIYLRQAELAFESGSYREAKGFAKLAVQSAEELGQPEFITKGRDLITHINKKIDETSEINRRTIGCLLPLKGPASLYGEELLKGIELGMDLFNTSDTDSLELVIKNTNYSSEETLKAIDELIFDEKVIAIIGPLSSSASVAAAKKAQEHGVPIITFSQKQNITEEGDMVFRNYLTPSRELDVLLNKAINEMGMSRFGIFYPETSYGNFFMNLFWDRIEEMGGEITAVESYKSEDTDFAEGIKKMVGLFYPRPESVFEMLKSKKIADITGSPADTENPDIQGDNPAGFSESDTSEDITDKAGAEDIALADPEAEQGEHHDDEAVIEEEAMTDPIVDFDAVFIPDNSQNIAQIAPQFPFNNVFNVPFLGTSLWLSDELIKSTSEYIQGAMFPVGFYMNSDSEIVRDFVSIYRDTYGADPGILAATGFDTIKLIKKLMQDNDIATHSDFQQALLDYDAYEGVTGRISFDGQGEVEKTPLLLTIHGRRLHVLQ